MTHLSLFSGIGGIDIAAHWAGFETVAFCERDEFCQKVLARHWPNVPIYDDVTTFDGTKFRGVTMLSAGFPCQPHSLAGKRKASGDERDLWGEVVRILGEARPRWFVGENVPGLLSSENGRFFGRILDDLAGMGYRVGWGVWKAFDAGAIHRRRRVFIVAYSDCNNFILPRMGDSAPAVEGDRTKEIGSGDWNRIRLDIEKVAPTKWGFAGGTESRPLLLRSDDGFSSRVDLRRLKALGNAVCPQQIYPLLKAIAENSR